MLCRLLKHSEHYINKKVNDNLVVGKIIQDLFVNTYIWIRIIRLSSYIFYIAGLFTFGIAPRYLAFTNIQNMSYFTKVITFHHFLIFSYFMAVQNLWQWYISCLLFPQLKRMSYLISQNLFNLIHEILPFKTLFH